MIRPDAFDPVQEETAHDQLGSACSSSRRIAADASEAKSQVAAANTTFITPMIPQKKGGGE